METHNNLDSFKHPVEPNDKQPMEGEYGYGVVDNMLGCALVNEVGELNNVDLNPNANAIKIVNDQLDYLNGCGSKSPQAEKILFAKIDMCNHILKLLQS